MSIDFNPLFSARLGVNFLCPGSHLVPLGMNPARWNFLPKSPAKTAEPQHDAAEPRKIAVVSLASTVPSLGIVPAARKVLPKWPGSTAEPFHITVSAHQFHPAPRGMHPAAHGEAVLPPQTALSHPAQHLFRLHPPRLRHHAKLHRHRPAPRHAHEMEIPRHLPRGRCPSRPLERGGECHRRLKQPPLRAPCAERSITTVHIHFSQKTTHGHHRRSPLTHI